MHLNLSRLGSSNQMERDNFQMPTLHGRFQILKENSSWKIHLIRDIRERGIIVLFCYCAAQILSQTDSCSTFLTPGAHNYQFYFNILSAHYIYFHLENFWVFFPWDIKISTLLIKLPRTECGWLGVLLWNIIVWKDMRQLQKKKNKLSMVEHILKGESTVSFKSLLSQDFLGESWCEQNFGKQ